MLWRARSVEPLNSYSYYLPGFFWGSHKSVSDSHKALETSVPLAVPGHRRNGLKTPPHFGHYVTKLESPSVEEKKGGCLLEIEFRWWPPSKRGLFIRYFSALKYLGGGEGIRPPEVMLFQHKPLNCLFGIIWSKIYFLCHIPSYRELVGTESIKQTLSSNYEGCCSIVNVMSDSLQPRGLQHTRLLCPSLSPSVC